MEQGNRKALLQMLIMLSQPVESTLKELARFGWDSAEELAVLEFRHIDRILRRYVDGELNASVVEGWANAIEGRDDIGYSEKDSASLKQFIFELANPELNQALSHDLARSILVRTQGIGADKRLD